MIYFFFPLSHPEIGVCWVFFSRGKAYFALAMANESVWYHWDPEELMLEESVVCLVGFAYLINNWLCMSQSPKHSQITSNALEGTTARHRELCWG